jgi:uncharacterized protein YggU (UPF0235/DUF167 family)
MKIFVQAKAGAKKEFVEKIDATHYCVAVRAVPQNNRANEAIIKSLADYFGISVSCVHIISGGTGKSKVFNIN